MIQTVEVDKFGGTSLSSAKLDRSALERVLAKKAQLPDDATLVLVCSGTGVGEDTAREKKATDWGYELINGNQSARDVMESIFRRNLQGHSFDTVNGLDQVLEDLQQTDYSGEHAARIIGSPERIKGRTLHHALQQQGIPSVFLDYYENGMVGMQTDNNIDVPIDHQRTLNTITQIGRARELKGKIVVLPGFVGTNPKGEMVTLERGMSDGTATYWGAALYADEVRIWSDNNGISPVDPTIIPGLDPIRLLTYREAEAFAGLGARIINDVAIRPSRERGTKVRILNSFEPNNGGTLITANLMLEHYGVKAVAHVPGHYVISVDNMSMTKKGVARKVSNIFSDCEINIESEADGDSCRSYAVFPNGNLGKLQTALEKAGHRTETINRISRIALVGEGMNMLRRTRDKTARRILFDVLDDRGIDDLMDSRARGSVMLSAFIREEYTTQAVMYLTRELGFLKP
jgi:bifunctional aspartokinase / homoserine dehydrogenase 1